MGTTRPSCRLTNPANLCGHSTSALIGSARVSFLGRFHAIQTSSPRGSWFPGVSNPYVTLEAGSSWSLCVTSRGATLLRSRSVATARIRPLLRPTPPPARHTTMRLTIIAIAGLLTAAAFAPVDDKDPNLAAPPSAGSVFLKAEPALLPEAPGNHTGLD